MPGTIIIIINIIIINIFITRAGHVGSNWDVLSILHDVQGWAEVLPAEESHQEVDVNGDGDQLGVGEGNVDPGEDEEPTVVERILVQVLLELHRHQVGLDPTSLPAPDSPIFEL